MVSSLIFFNLTRYLSCLSCLYLFDIVLTLPDHLIVRLYISSILLQLEPICYARLFSSQHIYFRLVLGDTSSIIFDHFDVFDVKLISIGHSRSRTPRCWQLNYLVLFIFSVVYATISHLDIIMIGVYLYL